MTAKLLKMSCRARLLIRHIIELTRTARVIAPQAILAASILAAAAISHSVLPFVSHPQAVAAGIAVLASGSAGDHSCILTNEGSVKCWGRNDYGQLGDGTRETRDLAVQVDGIASGAVDVAIGHDHTCVLYADGAVQCWGRGTLGQLGDGLACGSVCLSPVDVVGLDSVAVSIAVGHSHSCVATAEGSVKCWGNNYHGQLGGGPLGVNASTPIDVVGLDQEAVTVAAGDWHTCALTAGGALTCWGENLHGQVGNGISHTNQPSPVDVIGMGSGTVAVAPGAKHSCGLTSNGEVRCWGSNFFGQLGDGTTTDSDVPVSVEGLQSGGIAVSSGAFHTCTLLASGAITCWGRNSDGQIGDGSSNNRSSPADVTDLPSDVTALATGGFHSCAITTDDVAQCWGDNAFGQLGNGNSPTDSYTPIVVFGGVTKQSSNDADGDGCPDINEQQLYSNSEIIGGQRDFLDPWDFYDVETGGGVAGTDGVIDLFNDVVGVIEHYAPSGTEPAYDAHYDRGPSTGPNAWNMTAPDGAIDLLNDIVGVIAQAGHDCR